MQNSVKERDGMNIVITVILIIMFFELTAMMFMMASLVDGSRKNDRSEQSDKRLES